MRIKVEHLTSEDEVLINTNNTSKHLYTDVVDYTRLNIKQIQTNVVKKLYTDIQLFCGTVTVSYH